MGSLRAGSFADMRLLLGAVLCGSLEVPLSRRSFDPPISWDRLRPWLEHELEELPEPLTFSSLGRVLDSTIKQRAGGLSEMDAIAYAVEVSPSYPQGSAFWPATKP